MFMGVYMCVYVCLCAVCILTCRALLAVTLQGHATCHLLPLVANSYNEIKQINK